MEKIKTGLAAFGMSGQIFHAPFISTNPAFCLTAITERNKNLSKERYPSARIVRSFEELVALDELELVVINTPDSTHYEYTRKALEAGKNVIVETGIEQDFKMTPAQLEAAITPKTKLLILCSPSNPTGSVYSREELEALSSVLERNPQVFVISDEIYEHINYVGAHQSLAQFPSIRERIVIINGVSKGYAMTGWRIGFIAAPLWIAKACNKLQGQYTSGASSIAQKAAAAAFAGEQGCVETMRQAFQHRRDLVVRLAKEIPGLKVNDPQGAFYLFPEVSHYLGKSDGERKINTASDLAMYILEVGHVATVAG